MVNKGTFDRYLLALRETAINEKTEHTDRAALQSLLRGVAEDCGGGITVHHEPKRVADKGAPDFKIVKAGLILGYVENKPIGENLDRVLKSDQIARYRSLSPNIVLTDYLHFIWINKDGIQRETLCHATDLESPRFRLREDRIAAVSKLLQGFFSSAPGEIGRAEQLALALAARSRLLCDYLGEELVRQEREHQEGRLFGLFQIFRDQVFHELTLKEFADAYAQMLAYGLFLARLNSGSEPVTLHNARQFVPGSFRLIRELVDFLAELEKIEYRDVRWVVEEVLSIVNGLNLPAIHEDLSFRRRRAISRRVRAADEEEHRLFERDPFIYFYEDYLKAYDPAMRKGRGVYYTPPPVVNFIVRAVDDILKDSFGIPEGLADHRRVTVLDFACGTGTFLLEVCQRIFDNTGGPGAGRADLVVREHILKNLFGFEYLIAPYTIAHLKLSQYLRDQNHALHDDERLQVFLTNTLEPVQPQPNFLLPAITAEVEAAQKVKDREILVIVGNPPYAYESRNNGTAIMAAIEGYKYTIERRPDPDTPGGLLGPEERVPLGERNPRALNDDYVKFIRFAQLKMDAVGEGVVGIITNHAWLDNPTLRGMRQSLMCSFEQIFVLDLHGNANKKERAPDGSQDKNVFDIKQGVAVSLFVKRPGLKRGVWRGDLWGKRLDKYKLLADASFDNVDWNAIVPRFPQYLFRALAEDADYDSFPSVPEIFIRSSVGMVTGRDEIVVQFSIEQVLRITRILSRGKVAIETAGLKTGKDSTEWRLSDVIADIQGVDITQDKVKPLTYRPFDTRFAFRTGTSRGLINRPRMDMWRDFDCSNLGLATSRLTKGENFAHALVTIGMIEKIFLSSKTSNNAFVFPLYARNEEHRTENLSPDFRAFLDARYEHHYTGEEILGYMYAVLYSATYRTRYAEFLRIDFPRVPFPESADDFETLSGLGWALIQAHLLRELPRRGLAAYHGSGDHIVETVRYAPAEQAIEINKTQSFRLVPPPVWDFHIGGYQVLDKYLKSRRGRTLSLDEIEHVGAVADSLDFTIDRMASIDAAYCIAFPD
jgi:hypothetical protein